VTVENPVLVFLKDLVISALDTTRSIMDAIFSGSSLFIKDILNTFIVAARKFVDTFLRVPLLAAFL